MAEKKMLGRDDILAADDIEFEEVHVPEWGGFVRVKGLTAKEGDAFEESVLIRDGKEFDVNPRGLRAKLVALTAVDPEGKLIFSEEDVDKLGDKSRAALDRVFKVSQQLSGIGEKEMEALESDLENAQESGSDSV